MDETNKWVSLTPTAVPPPTTGISVSRLDATGRLVSVPGYPGKLSFERFAATVDDLDAGVTVEIEVEIGERPLIKRAAVAAKTPVTPTAVAHLRWGSYLRLALEGVVFNEASEVPGVLFQPPERDRPPLVDALISPSRQRVDPERLQNVAAWYREAEEAKRQAKANGEPRVSIQRYVADRAFVGENFARQLIQKARHAGYLEPASYRRGGDDGER